MTEQFKAVKYEELDHRAQELVQASEQALRGCYAPYSRFCVGAALFMEDGSIEFGSNQENAAYPSGLCAERVAVFSVASRYPDKAIRQLCVSAKRDPDGPFLPVSPCGACRQVILEMELRQKSPIQIIMMWKPEQWIVAPSAASLLPYSFSSGNL